MSEVVVNKITGGNEELAWSAQLENGNIVFAVGYIGAGGVSIQKYDVYDSHGNYVTTYNWVNTSPGGAGVTTSNGFFEYEWGNLGEYNFYNNSLGYVGTVDITENYTGTAYNKTSHMISEGASGQLYGLWVNEYITQSWVTNELFITKLDAQGQPVGAPLSVASEAGDWALHDAYIKELGNGNVLVTWWSETDHRVGKILDSNFNTVYGKFALFGIDDEINVISLGNNGFAVQEIHDRPWLLYRYNANGTANGAAVNLLDKAPNIHDNLGYALSPTKLADGSFVVVWDDGVDVYARMFDGNMTAKGASFKVNTDTTYKPVDNGYGIINAPGATSLQDGGFFVQWGALSGDGTTDIYVQRYDAGGTAIDFAGAGTSSSPTSGNDNIVGTAGDDHIDGLAGDDVISGAAGNDTLIGGDGADTLIGGNGNDSLAGGIGIDSMAGGGGNDIYLVGNAGDIITELSGQGADLIKSSITYSLVDTDGAGSNGGNVEKLTLTGTAAINGTGNGLANTLTGNSAANILKGNAGNDTLVGNGGNDKLYGGAGNDVLTGGAGTDRFIFDTARNAATNIDTLKDFVHGTDKIVLDDDFYALGIIGTNTGVALTAGKFCLGTAAGDATDRIIYDKPTGKLYYDVDGTGSAGKVQFALIGTTTHPTLSASDFLIIA